MGLFKAIGRSTIEAKESGEDYIRLSKEYYKLKVFHQSSLFASYFLKTLLLGALLFLAVIFAALSLAIYLGAVFDSMVWGYLMVGAFFLVLVCFAYIFRRGIERKVIHKLGKTFFDQ